jgi:hypothetical protein
LTSHFRKRWILRVESLSDIITMRNFLQLLFLGNGAVFLLG